MDNLKTISILCSSCGAAFERVAEMERERDGWKLAQRQALVSTTDLVLRISGVGDAERTAKLDHVPVALKKFLPRDRVEALLLGAIPPTGFGLSGGQGSGKTFALAALLQRRTYRALLAILDAATEVPSAAAPVAWYARAGFAWLAWPDKAARLKSLAVEDKGSASVEALTRAWSSAPLLVLDDLGRERVAKGGYDEDFAIGVLDRVVDARSRSARPILWTSNLGAAGLASRYGAALTSRLLGNAPAVELPKTLGDLRLSGGARP
jgi:DNA replication protein DnaC